MERNCENCRLHGNLCSVILPFPERGCSEFVSRQKKFIAVHYYNETEISSILGFSDSYAELLDIVLDHPRYGSGRHNFCIFHNIGKSFVQDIKDECLVNLCKNVAEYLSIGEYAMLKKSYFKSAAWFEKAKNSASLGADIIENY